MNKLLVGMTLFIMAMPLRLAAQEESVRSGTVSNVYTEQKDNKIHVHYHLGGRFYQKSRISLHVSFDRGRSFEGPMQKVSGDTGYMARKGDKLIIWDALAESDIIEDTLMFEVRNDVEDNRPQNRWFIQYCGNTMTYLGLRGGMAGIVGFYGELRTNTRPAAWAEYTEKNGNIEYTGTGYFETTGVEGYSALSVLGGIIYQPARNLYLYLGAGYGKENYVRQINTYSYESGQLTGTTWVKVDGYCSSGLEIDAGLMVKIKRVLLSAGVTEISFKSFNWTLGAGILL